MTRRIPAPNSMAIVITRSTCAIGRPFEAIMAAVWSKPPILLQPDLMKMTARRMRPMRAAASATFALTADGKGWFMGLFASVFMVFSWSWQVEKEGISRARLVDAHFGFVLQLESVARGKAFAIHARLAANDVDVRAAAGADGMGDRRVGCIDVRDEDARGLVDAHRPVAAVGRSDEAPLTAPGSVVETLLFVARRDAANARLDPDLQEMNGLPLGSVVFAVRDTRARAHALHVAGPDDRAVAHRIAVCEPALEHVADDFHVAVAMGAEPPARLHAILVDHAQRPKARVAGGVVVGEGKAMEGVEPPVLGMAAFVGPSNVDHLRLSSVFTECDSV